MKLGPDHDRFVLHLVNQSLPNFGFYLSSSISSTSLNFKTKQNRFASSFVFTMNFTEIFKKYLDPIKLLLLPNIKKIIEK